MGDLAGSQMLEKCEGLPNSPGNSADTREHVFVKEDFLKQYLGSPRAGASKAGGGGFPGLGSGTDIRGTGGGGRWV